MNTLKKILALCFVLLFAITGVACNKEEEDTLLTTKKRKPSSTAADSGIDIWEYLNGEGATDPSLLGEEPGTLSPVRTPSRSTGNYTYEDISASFGGSSIFSSATTSKAGYPTFHWNPVSGAIRYNIYRSTSQNGTYTFLDSTTATSYTDKTAIEGQKYFYQVKAVKKATVPSSTKKNDPTQSPTVPTIPTKPQTPDFTTRNTANAPATAPKGYNTYAEIVSFYNAAANKVKTDAKSVTRTERTVKYIEDENNSSTVKTLLALAGIKETTNTTPQTFNTPATIRDEFPVEGKNVSSTLTPDMVAAASCTYSGGYYTVKIVLKADPEKTTAYSGTCVNVLDASKYTSTAKSETRGCQILAKIYYDGTLDQLGQYAPTWVFADYQTNDVTVNGQAALSITEIWVVNY